MATYEELEIEVRQHGSRTQKVKCPACSHTRKNKNDKPLSVNLDKGAYNCHNCGWSGFVSGKTKEEEKAEWKQQNKDRKEWAKPAVVELPLEQKVIDWFNTRGIEPETLQYFKVTQSMDWMPEKSGTPSGTRRCINFNYYRDLEKVNIKYRDALKCFRMTKDAELILYNLNALKERTDMLICEGEIDCMTFYQSGYYGAVSVPNGASKGNARLEYLDNCAEAFEHMTKIIIAVDGDEAGAYLRSELIRRLGSHRCWLVEYPEGCKDANEVLLKYGPDAVRKLWKSAVAPPLESVFSCDDLRDDLDEIYLNGWPQREPIGLESLDELLNFGEGEVTVITGIPGHGKDEFITQIITKKAARYGHKSAIFNFEEPAKIIQLKCAQKYIGRPFYRKNRDEMMNPAQKDAAYKFLNEHIFIIDNDTADLTIDGLISKAVQLVLRKGIKFFVIGPFNCLTNDTGLDVGEYAPYVMKTLTVFARRYGVHVFLVAHPTKVPKENGKFIVPTLYMISGSAHFFNMTHNGMTIYRNYEDNTTDVYVQKVKMFFNGKLGMASFKFDVETGRYQELGIDFDSEIRYQKSKEVQLQIEIPKPVELNTFPPTDLTAWGQPTLTEAPF